MSLLFFWKGENYRKDMIVGPAYHLNQDSVLLSQVRPGDHIWAFTRRQDKTYVLALDLVVSKVTNNRPGDDGSEYGRHHVEGDRARTRYFDVDAGPDVEPLIRELSFKPQARTLGSSFQGPAGVKKLTVDDERRLEAFAERLRVI